MTPEARRRLLALWTLVARKVWWRPRWGNLRRKRPFSEYYGYDRGQPVDRAYIERFLRRAAAAVSGDVLEVRGSHYTSRYGTGIVRSHILDINASNAAATIVGDLCDHGTLPTAAFDCVILTQTLQYVRDPPAALANVWSSLRPSGTLLITVPCMSRVDNELPQSDFWRWTPQGLSALLADACPEAEIEIEVGGNLVVALAYLLGLAVEDLRRSDLTEDDPAFPVTACAAARKPVAEF
jgi:SAM-dependent methyltransferase